MMDGAASKYLTQTSSSWVIVEQVLKMGLQLLQSVVLARLLTPAEFGVAASVLLVVGLATAFADPGVSTLLVQYKKLSPVREATAFWGAAFSGTIVSLCVLLVAPVAAHVTGVDEILLALQLTTLSTLFVAFSALPSGKLMRQMQFRKLAVVGIASSCTGLIAGIVAARNNFGVLTLFVVPLATSASANLLYWLVLRQKVHGVTSWMRLAALGKDAIPLVGARVTDAFQGGVTNAAIAGSAGFQELGLFGRAEALKQMPIALASAVIGRLYFPRFAAELHKGEGMGLASESLLAACKTTMLLATPLFALICVYSYEFTLLMYGQNWTIAAPVLALLVPGAALQLLNAVHVNFLLGRGASADYFRLDVLKKGILLSTCAVLVFDSVFAFAAALSISWLIICLMYAAVLRRLGASLPGVFSVRVFRYVLASILLSLLLILVRWLSSALDQWLAVSLGTLTMLLCTPVIYRFCGLLTNNDFLGLPFIGIRIARAIGQRDD